MARFQYGGQALIEGVLMRGRNVLAVALRHPDGSIVWATERLDLGLRARRAMKLPLLRGLVVLYDTLVTGTRWLVRSATVQALALEDGEAKGGPAGPAALLQTLAILAVAPVIGAATSDDVGSDYTDPDAPAAGTRGATGKPGAEEGLGSCSPCCLASASSFCSLSSSPRRPSAVSTRASVCSCRRG
jgi:hypothetical protein